MISNFILPLQERSYIMCGGANSLFIKYQYRDRALVSENTKSTVNQPALEKDRYKIRQAFVAAPGNSLIVADYGQLELRILAHLTNCKSMLDAFKAGGDFHSRTAMNMYQHIRDAVHEKKVLLEWHSQTGQEKPPVPLLKDAFGAERRKAKMLNFSIAYGKTAVGLSEDWEIAVFDDLPRGDVVAHSFILAVFLRAGLLRSLRAMVAGEDGVSPSAHALSASAKACFVLRNHRAGACVHGAVVVRGFGDDGVVLSALVDMYGDAGVAVDARRTFEEMRAPDGICYTSLISAFVWNDWYKEAMRWFRAMVTTSGVWPGGCTFGSMMTALGNLKRAKQGREAHAQVVTRGLCGNVIVERSTLDMYAKCGMMVDACKVFDRMKVRNAVSWMREVSFEEARDTLELWYRDRKEVLAWQKSQKKLAREKCEVYTLLGRSRHFPNLTQVHPRQRGHIERAAINAPVQGSAADVVMCAMLEIERNARLKELGWRLLLQVHDEVILEGPSEFAEVAKAIIVECMSKPFYGTNILKVDLAVDAKCSKSWYAAK
ncbi:hypothetical protein ACP70R_046205 [Stipagrostis hirtigluma subsp. patula]